jgi:hypothetical protein
MSMMSALAEIIAVVRVVDEATAPLARVGNAARAASGIMRGLVDSVVGMAGARGLYDWTVKSAQNYQMMQLGLAAIIQMHSKVADSAARGMSAAEQMQAKYNTGLALSQQMMDKLQAKALSGVGTFQDYGSMFQQLAPTLIGMEGKNAFTEGGMDRMANFINMAEHFKAIMMSGYGDGKRANDLTARELSMIMNHNARSSEPVFRNLFPDYLGRVKQFNEMAPIKKFELLNQRLNQFAVVSGDISKTWAAISTSVVDAFQMIGRGIGTPIMKALSDLAMKVPLIHNMMGLANKGDHTDKNGFNTDSANRQVQAYKDIVKFGTDIGEAFIKPFKVVADVVVPLIAQHWQAVLAATKIAATAISIVIAKIALARLGSMAGNVAGPMVAVAANFLARVMLGMQRVANQGGLLGLVFSRLAGGAGLGSLIARFAILATGVASVVGALFFLYEAMKRVIETTNVGAMAWERIRNRLEDIASTITGHLYPAGTSLWTVLGDVAAKIVTELIPVAWWLIQQIEQVCQIIQVAIATFQWMGNTLNWLADAGPAAFARFIDGIMSKIGGDLISGAIAKLPNDGSRQIAQGMADVVNKGLKAAGIDVGAGARDMARNGRNYNQSGPNGPGQYTLPPRLDLSPIFRNGRWQTPHQYGPPAPPKSGGTVPIVGSPLEHGNEGSHKPKKGKHPREHHPKTTNVFQRGAINIEIKNMNNYPPDRIAYDMKKALLDRVQYKTTHTGGGIGGYSATFGGY